MKEGTKFRRGFRYRLSDGAEHREDCKCGCLSFSEYAAKKLYGAEIDPRRSIVTGQPITINTR
jgi:hypothetical protein